MTTTTPGELHRKALEAAINHLMQTCYEANDGRSTSAQVHTAKAKLLAEIARLEGERDRAIENHRDVARRKIVVAQWRDRFKARADAAESALAACREESERLREGLKPFADVAGFMDSETSGLALTDELSLVCKSEAFEDVLFSAFEVQTFHHARALVEGGGDGR